jgi:enterochelin esterase family protein
MGASAGGLMALFTALRAPHVFRRVLSQSGAFGWEGGHKPFVFDLAQYLPVRPLRIWLDCGLYEGLLPGNRDMYDLLTRRGYDAQYREYPAGHNYPAWRDDLWRGLEALYPAS